jgi:hypothetical protein
VTFSSKHWRRRYPAHWMSFTRMHQRVRDGYVSTIWWPRTDEGFIDFMLYVGKVPRGMVRPSIGRKNHSKGYAPNNCGWQALGDNVAEVGRRNRGRKLTKAHKQKVSMALSGREFTREHREKLSMAAKKRIYTREECEAISQRVKQSWRSGKLSKRRRRV